MMSRVVPLGVTSFLKELLKNLLWPVACPRVVSLIRGSCRWLPLEFLVVPVCAFILLAWVCHATLDLVVVVWLSSRCSAAIFI